MADVNDLFPNEDPTNANRTEIARYTIEDQPTAAMPPVGTPAQAHLADEKNLRMPPDPVAPAQATMPDLPMGAQIPAGYPPTAAYVPNYAQPGYPQHLYPQPSAPLPLQPGQPGLLSPRKRHTRLLVLVIAILVFILGSGTALAVVVSEQLTNTPTQALQQYCDGYKTSNAQKIYDTLSSASKKKNSLSKIQQGFDALKAPGNTASITDCSISNVQQHDSTATGKLKMTVNVSSGSFSFSVPVLFTMGLVLEDKTWKIDMSQTHMTLPNLAPGLLTPTASDISNQQL